MGAKTFFTSAEQKKIVQAIESAEKNTSGEIKVHMDNKCPGDVLDSATAWFKKLKMDKTELRNGVLFYLSVDDKKFAIIGDKGIHEKVPEGFWDSIRDIVIDHFKKQKFSDGLIQGIEMAGEKLKLYFPYKTDDTNELNNDISFN
jgi:uncharacterized membrane protein